MGGVFETGCVQKNSVEYLSIYEKMHRRQISRHSGLIFFVLLHRQTLERVNELTINTHQRARPCHNIYVEPAYAWCEYVYHTRVGIKNQTNYGKEKFQAIADGDV